ncbi:ABC transporter permease [Jiangella sp. DSM 45060]|uniref:ABC transporter permease n=1 Tax=Jiangella sp. DSM 45060 TaxID=1798224 RepID=UPI000879ED0B|nr:ABC transporter permease [Jiangella sp. DSM 45060]SDS88059.1 peptide/nickel transport system permease protein [Jiangella sp. DSM 45060]
MIAVIRRVLVALIVLWGVATVVFFIVRAAPGDPATAVLGPDASADQVAALRESMGLNRPLVGQYAAYLGDLVSLDLGDSHRLGRPAIDAVAERLPATVELTLAATLIAVAAGLVLGALAGRRAGSIWDRLVSTATIGLQSFPTFWVGIMFILLFALTLGVLPSAGAGTPAHLVLPAVTLALPFTAIVARLTRSSMADTLTESYILTARAKGLTERQVLTGHVLRNSLVPVVTIVALQMGALMGGAVVVENVFAWPGLGSLIVDAIGNRDYAVVQAATLVIATIVVALNLLVDLAYRAIDPRIRTGDRA